MKHDISSAGASDPARGGTLHWQALVEQAQAAYREGDQRRAGYFYSDLVTLTQGWLLKIAYKKVPQDEAEVIVVRVQSELWGSIIKPEPVTNVRGLLVTILERRITDYYRSTKNKTRRTLEQQKDPEFWNRLAETKGSSELDPAQLLEEQETHRAGADIRNTLLDELSDEERAVLIARKEDNLSTADTAARLNLTEDQVKKRLRAAVKRVKHAAQERGLI